MSEQERAMWAAVYGAEYVRQRAGDSFGNDKLAHVVAVDAADCAIIAARATESSECPMLNRFTKGLPE